MSAMQRRKGASGELEVASLVRDLLGVDAQRRVRQHAGDSDLCIPGWAPEVKRHARIGPADLRVWWKQTCEQAAKAGLIPVLFTRADRSNWRATWPLSLHLCEQTSDMWASYTWAIESTVDGWAAAAREIAARAGTQDGRS